MQSGGDTMPDPQRSPSEPVGSKAERRNLTVLFCDIVGSTALSARLDPEDLRHILRGYQAACGEAIGRFDGHIARFMGDGVLAYFGFPAAHEDDAERAVNAALQMIESIPSWSAPPLELRIGIATGLVVVGDLIGEGPSREFALIGEAPNLAAHLQQLARPNQILVSERTRRLLGLAFDYADLGEHAVKGHDRPLRLWSVARSSEARSRFDAHRGEGPTAFVGREAELAALLGDFDAAKRGEGRLVTICGEPGIGKSRLIAALRQRLAGENHLSLMLQCSSYHASSPWYPVIRHFEDVIGIAHDTSPSDKLAKLEEWAQRNGMDRDRIVPALAALLAVPSAQSHALAALTPQQQKRRLVAALVAMVRAQSAAQPLIVICEDIHWIDPTSWEMIEVLRREAKDCRLLLILSFRPEFHLEASRGWNATSLVLGRLEPPEVEGMIAALGPRLPQDVIERIVAKTDGVPLFVEEVTRVVLERRGAGDATNGAAPTIPDTLHDSLMARLDRLAPTKTLAQIAAAIGREFALDLVEAVAPYPRAEIEAAMDKLVAAGLVSRREGIAAERYAFKHALVQDAAYASMLRDERRELHLRIAEALRAGFAELAESAPELVAHHYTEARAARPAIEHWLKAGRLASSRTAFAEAIVHFETALGLLRELPESPERDAAEIPLQQALGSAFIAAKGFAAEETIRAFDRALQLCEKVEASPQTFAVLNGMAGVHFNRGDFERSRAVAEDLLERARASNDVTALLMGHRMLGMAMFVVGELDAARRELESALALYDPPRHAPLALVFSQDFKATAQAYLGLATVMLGDVEAGLGEAHRALGHAEGLRHPHSICYVLTFLTGAYLAAGKSRDALPFAERTIAMSAEYGFPQWLSGGHLLRGWARIDSGEAEAGLADIRLSIGELEATGTLIWMQFAHFLLARALALTGRSDEAMGFVDRVLAEIGRTSGRWYEPAVHRLKGELLAASGAPAAAEACFASAIAAAARQGARLWQLNAENALTAATQ